MLVCKGDLVGVGVKDWLFVCGFGFRIVVCLVAICGCLFWVLFAGLREFFGFSDGAVGCLVLRWCNCVWGWVCLVRCLCWGVCL